MPGPKINKKLCKGCGECARSCPAKTIFIKDKLAVIESEKCICDYCGKEFVSKPNFKGERRFCSEECGDKWKHEKDYEIRICSECGKEFNVYKYSKTKYCSRECVEKARARNYNKK